MNVRKLATTISCLALIPIATLPAANAASYTTMNGSSAAAKCRQDPIMSGLWAGVNLTLDTNGCAADSSTSSNQYQHSASARPVQGNGIYVALGDSVAAGAGLPPASGSDPACGVSSQAYPSHVASAAQMSYINLACSGATVGDLFTEQHLPNTRRDIEPQLATAFAYGQPSLITVTAGANDVYWPYFLRHCYASTCGTTADEATMSTLRSALRLKLEYALASISTMSNNQPPLVIVTGYYQPLSTACTGQQTGITPSELAWINSQTSAINRTLSKASSGYSFVRFTPISFSGHELCTSDPWVQGVNAAAPFHPTARGQQTIAQTITAQIR